MANQQQQDELLNLLRMGSGGQSLSGPEKYIVNIANSGLLYTALRNDDTSISWEIPSLEDTQLTGTTNCENLTVEGDLTLNKGAKFTAGSGAEMDVECDATFSGNVDLTGAVVSGIFPTITNDRYLHTNSSTGALEWSQLATVATTGSYNDLSDKPTIPSDYVKTGNVDQQVDGFKTFIKALKGTGLYRNVDNNALDLCGGSSFVHSAFIKLFGQNFSEKPAWFQINAGGDDVSSASTLTGKPDGTLTWNVHGTEYNVLTDGQTQTISGVKTFSDTINANAGDGSTTGIRTTVDSSMLALYGSTGKTNGAYLYLFGKNYSNAGGFSVRANDGTTTVQLNGRTDGTLTWNGNSLVGVKSTPTAGTGVTFGNSSCSYVRVGNMVFVWGIIALAAGTYAFQQDMLTNLPTNSSNYGTGMITVNNSTYRIRMNPNGTSIQFLDSLTLTGSSYGSFTFMYLAA